MKTIIALFITFLSFQTLATSCVSVTENWWDENENEFITVQTQVSNITSANQCNTYTDARIMMFLPEYNFINDELSELEQLRIEVVDLRAQLENQPTTTEPSEDNKMLFTLLLTLFAGLMAAHGFTTGAAWQ